MKALYLIILYSCINLPCFAVETLPEEAQTLLKKRGEAVARIDDKLNVELEKVKARCMQAGDLEGANAVAALIQEPNRTANVDASDPMIGTVWNFLGVNRQKINEFTFLKGGKVRCESEYKEATWRRLDANTILFGYSPEGGYIVLYSDGSGKFMSGLHKSGRSRSIARIK